MKQNLVEDANASAEGRRTKTPIQGVSLSPPKGKGKRTHECQTDRIDLRKLVFPELVCVVNLAKDRDWAINDFSQTRGSKCLGG